MPLARTNRGTKSVNYAGSNSTNTLTSNAFTPAGGALLVVLFDEITNDAGHALTMSSTFSGQGAWTIYSVNRDDGFGNKWIARIAWSVCGGSPGSGTVTCTRPAGSTASGMFAEFIEVTGQDAAAPIRQNAQNSGTGSSLATTLGSAPLASSYLFTSVGDSATGAAAPSGMTMLGTFDSNVGAGGGYHAHAEKLGSGAQANTWTGLNSFINVANL